MWAQVRNVGATWCACVSYDPSPPFVGRWVGVCVCVCVCVCVYWVSVGGTFGCADAL